jgi:TetR/AcrR family transcriptional regulator, fatty acid metabolism regulator protein
MGLKKVKTKIRQAQIVEAALEAISKNGFKGLTISAIAGKVGIADGNVYRHFKDKDAVLEAIISGIGIALKRIVKKSRKEESGPLSCLEKIFTKHISFLENHRGIPRIIFSDEMYSGNKKLALKLKGSVTEYGEEIKNILRQGIKDGSLDCNLDVDAAAIALVGLIQSTALQWVLFGYSFSPKTRAKKIWQIYLKGILSGR